MRLIHPIICLLFLSFITLDAQTPQNSLFEVFQKQDLLEVTLTTDFENMLSEKRNEEYQPATFLYEDENGTELTHFIKVRQRGKYRRRICEMPPLKLNFDKDELEDVGLKDFDKMKLVTYCVDDPSSRENVIREYLTYQLYNELTPYSYRTQLIKITYIDSANPKNKVKHFGFLIESTRELAHRIDGKEIEAMNVDKNQLNEKQEVLVSTFQYMIGNEDWSTMFLRNVKLLKPNDGGKIILVPYDFDFSGLVDASYAIPNSNVGLKSIQERAFMGIHDDEKTLNVIKDYLNSKRDNLYEIVNNCRYLSRTGRFEVIEYLDTYYQAE